MSVLCILLAGSPAAGQSQTKWFKYEGNPVLKVGPPGSWDGNLAIPARVIRTDSAYHMWYTGFAGTRYLHTGYARSRDGIRWKKYEGNPVLRGGPDAWDNAVIAHGYVMPTASGFEMWYTGSDTGRTLQLGYATSANPVAWKKSATVNPILKVGPTGLWDSRGLSHPSILGPDSSGHYKMWFAGEDATVIIKIGFATGTSATSWTKAPDPVLEPGNPGSWDDQSVFYPRVLYHHGLFEMWYGGMTATLYASRKVGYATSPDGIHWTRCPDNPVFTTGPSGTWDGYSVLMGDVLFDGEFYHLWYHGIDANEVGVGQIGYAISPAGARIEIGPSYVPPGIPVIVRMYSGSRARLSFTAEICDRDSGVVKLLELLDDGNHGDEMAADGEFANSWMPPAEANYVVNLRLRFRNNEFVLNNAGAFSTLGPITFKRLELIGARAPKPGDTLFAKVHLTNESKSAPARGIQASLSSADSLVTDIAAAFPSYGDIPPGGSSVSAGIYGLLISPECPVNTDVKLKLSITSSGVPYRQETILLRVVPPWWRTPWAFALYALGLAGVVLGAHRFIGGIHLRRRVQQLERDQALERERIRISRDMHDEVGARLTEIGILGELARKGFRDTQKTDAQIQKITETSREVISSISEIIWAMDSRNDALDDLVAYLREYASKCLGTAGIACEFNFPDGVPELRLSAEARRNVFLVVKETLHNSVKHSAANRVRMDVDFSFQMMRISIKDNGRGFDATHPSRFGNGLRNMAKRMNDIGGTFEILSTTGGGTRAELAVKLDGR